LALVTRPITGPPAIADAPDAAKSNAAAVYDTLRIYQLLSFFMYIGIII
jgi:hypothetical protein